jgi:solute carrier family 25 carnitine/acylcarnitine transporter 20/29
MSADFWAGYISGAAGILIGNPLDLIKVRLQAGTTTLSSSSSSIHSTSTITPRTYTSQFSSASSLIRGATAPILGYGALNALLFVTYNRTRDLLHNTTHPSVSPQSQQANLWTIWLAGAIGGLATWVVSTPTELIKCRAQLSSSSTGASTWGITREILKTEGVKGLYFGGVVTALRDSIGYGFYFWSYELSTRFMLQKYPPSEHNQFGTEAAKVLLCGGLAGVVTWASIFPLDVIKTRVQTQVFSSGEHSPLLSSNAAAIEGRRLGAIEVARNAYRNEGVGVFFKGLMVCSIRAFMVNAVQWAVYEWMMRELDPQRKVSLGLKEGNL